MTISNMTIKCTLQQIGTTTKPQPKYRSATGGRARINSADPLKRRPERMSD
jgi:hypothetical protein